MPVLWPCLFIGLFVFEQTFSAFPGLILVKLSEICRFKHGTKQLKCHFVITWAKIFDTLGQEVWILWKSADIRVKIYGCMSGCLFLRKAMATQKLSCVMWMIYSGKGWRRRKSSADVLLAQRAAGRRQLVCCGSALGLASPQSRVFSSQAHDS